MNAYSNTSTSFFGVKFQRNIDEILISPLPNFLILLGFLLGGVFRGITVGVMVLIVALFFTHVSIHHVLITLSVAILSAFIFSCAGFINGMLANSFDGIAIIPTFVLTPLTYLGGVFFTLAMLPPFWRRIAEANPLLYLISAFRYGMLGVTDINVYISFAVISIFSILLFGCCWWLLETGIGLKS